MQKKMLLVLLFPLLLHGMDDMSKVFDVSQQEKFRFELQNAIQNNDSTKENECYKNICLYVIANNKNYDGSLQKFKEKCEQDILRYVPICFNGKDIDVSSKYRFIKTLDECRKILATQLRDIQNDFVKPSPQPSILCNNLVWASCALVSGFAYGVMYRYSTC